MLIRFFSVFLLLAAASAPSFAQGSAAAPAPLVKFTTMAWDVLDPDRDLVLNYRAKGEQRIAEILWRERSLPMVCDGAGPLVFTRTVERDGKRTEVPVATATIPAGMTRALLVFGRNPSPAPGESLIKVLVIDDSYSVFPGQSVRFLNYSRMSLGGSLGGRSFEVSPGGDQVVAASLPEANRLLPFRLARRDATGAWKKLRSTGLPMSEGLRVLVFLIDDPMRPERAEMVILRDQMEPPAPAGTLAKVAGLRVNPAGR